MPKINTGIDTEDVSYSSRNSTSIPAHGNEDQVVHWFPMRVAYDKILLVKRILGILGVNHFLPLEEKIDVSSKKARVVRTPIISDLIFVHSSKNAISELKHSSAPCRYLRFITYIPKSQLRSNMTSLEKSSVNRILIIPDVEMSKFIYVMTQMSNHVALIPYSEAFNHVGRKIRILQGPLAGYTGTLRRIKNNKHVHIDCGGLVTIELGYMQKGMYEIVEDRIK